MDLARIEGVVGEDLALDDESRRLDDGDCGGDAGALSFSLRESEVGDIASEDVEEEEEVGRISIASEKGRNLDDSDSEYDKSAAESNYGTPQASFPLSHSPPKPFDKNNLPLLPLTPTFVTPTQSPFPRQPLISTTNGAASRTFSPRRLDYSSRILEELFREQSCSSIREFGTDRSQVCSPERPLSLPSPATRDHPSSPILAPDCSNFALR